MRDIDRARQLEENIGILPALGVLRLMADDVQRFRAEAGRTGPFPVMPYHNVNIGPDVEGCLAESKRFLDAYYGPTFTSFDHDGHFGRLCRKVLPAVLGFPAERTVME